MAYARGSGGSKCSYALGGFADQYVIGSRSSAGADAEVWFQDEARIGQKNSLTRVWGQTGSRPVAPKDLGFASAYLFGAAVPSNPVKHVHLP